MPTIDERVVAMAFENAKFEQAIAQTMKSLDNLNKALAQVGANSGFDKIENMANKVSFQGPMSALDKLKAKLGGTGQGAADGFNEIERAGNKVQLQEPMSALDKLRARLANVGSGAADGFAEVERGSSRVSLQGLNSALDSVTAKFSVLSGAASVAFGNISSQATMRAGGFIKGFTFGPILGGLEEYQTNLKAIQTVQANTDQPLTKINASLNQLNHYSDLTIYNFGEMAKNIGTFTAAGVDLKTATSSIKGIANMAALSGSSSQQASVAMYQLSQAIASGKVGLQDWNSVVNAGMGGKKLQTALTTTGQAMGKLGQNSVKMEGPLKKLTINGQSFRESIMAKPGQQPWLTSDILVNTLATLDGRFSKMALSQEKTKDGLVKYSAAQVQAKINASRLALEQKSGVKYTDAQFKALMKLSDSAFKSATEVKTLGQVFDVAKEAIGSGWSQSFQSIFGNLKEAKTLFTGMSNAINGAIGANALARNTMLHDWKKLGGRKALIDGLKTAFKDLGAILKPIGQAFRDVFPRKTGKDLADMTKNFANLMHNLKPSAAVVDGIRRTFRGFFSVLSIGWYIVKKLIGVVGSLLGTIGGGAGGFLHFTGGIGDMITNFQKVIVQGDALKGFFNGLSKILQAPFELIKGIAGALGGLFTGVDPKKTAQVGDAVGTITDKVGPLEDVLKRLGKVASRIISTVNKVFEPFSKTVSGIGHAIVDIGNSIANTFEHANFDNIFGAIQTALVGGIFLAIKKALGQPINLLGGVTGTLNKIKGVLGGLTTNLQQMQHVLKAATLLAIGAAIIALAVGIKILSSIDPKRLTSAMTAVAIGLGQLVGALFLMSRSAMSGPSLLLIATAMVEVAAAVTLLAVAMKIFATMSMDQITNGLIAMGGALATIGLAMKMIGPSITLSAPGILAVALAMNVLAVAMKMFGSMKWDEIVKGIIGMGGALLALGFGVQMLGPSLLLVGPGLIVASAGLLLLSAALVGFGAMDLGTLIKGILGMGAALVVLGIAISAIPPTIALQAAGLVIAGIALAGLAGAVKAFGSMDLGTLVKGIVSMAAALLVLAVGLTMMIPTLPGSAALLAAAAAFAVLTPVIGILGTLSFGTILKGLGAMAGVLVVLGVVGGLASTGLIALGLGLAAVGLGVTVIGAGIYLIVKALVILGDASIKSTGVVIAAITAFIAVIPKMAIEFAKGLLVIAEQAAALAPKIVDALAKVIISLIDTVIKILPKLQELVNKLMEMFIQVINDHSADFIAAGWRLLENFLSGINSHIGSVTNKLASIVTRFLNALANNMPHIIAAGARVIISFLQGVGDHLPAAMAVGARVVVRFLGGIARAIPGVVGKVGTIIAKFIWAIGDQIPKIMRAGVHLARKFIRSVAHALLRVVDTAADAVIWFMNALAKTIEKHSREFVKAGFRIGTAIMKGVIEGMADLKKQADEFLHPDKKQHRQEVEFLRKHKNTTTYQAAVDAYGVDIANQVYAPGERTAAKDKKRAARLKHAGKKRKSGKGGARKKIALDTAGNAVEIDPNPTITPVLDLTTIKKQSGDLHTLTHPKSVARTSLAHATAASRATEARRHRTAAEHHPKPVQQVTFKQINTSPRALSEQEIYRRTKNQLAQAKKKLGLHGDVAVIGT